jgi:hypothetical protein
MPAGAGDGAGPTRGGKRRKAEWANDAAWQLGQEEEKGRNRGSLAQEGKKRISQL